MESIKKTNRRSWHPLLWAVLTAMTSFIILFFVGYVLSFIEQINVETGAVFAYIIYDLLIILSCYFICNRYPGSIFYVPVVANIMGIISSIVEQNFWSSYLWILVVGGWVFSIAAAYIGYRKRKKL